MVESRPTLAPALSDLLFHYQPIFGLALKPIIYEALVRWRNPEGLILAPVHFLAELLEGPDDTLAAFTALTIDSAAAQIHQNDLMPRVSINLSPAQICRQDTFDHLSSLPERIRERLIIEVTEQHLPDRETYSLWLGETAALGLDLILDDLLPEDFESRLLPRLPVEGVKLDRRLLSELLSPNPDAQLLDSVRSLRHLKLSVAVEGVEHQSQLEVLARYGFDRFQGFGLGMPLPAPTAERSVSLQPAVGHFAAVVYQP